MRLVDLVRDAVSHGGALAMAHLCQQRAELESLRVCRERASVVENIEEIGMRRTSAQVASANAGCTATRRDTGFRFASACAAPSALLIHRCGGAAAYSKCS
jgi:hypothetical protein